ncbi:hypothetical protein [Ferrovibrio sp.]|uniref:hypothetical protein n=1 Tax=Ferrovibrio sp. TaxID=1917215 RepID=UPI0025C15C2C|nr:hypothetical protein [Ferrovibrio sp.]MBX3456380.1 hypothetical protein [Ferrovibrio sp.]
MLDAKQLFQPRGPHTGWTLRLKTPPTLVGINNPHSNEPFGTKISIGLKTRDVHQAQKQQDMSPSEPIVTGTAH